MTLPTSVDPQDLADRVRAAIKADFVEAARLLRDIQEEAPELLQEVRRAADIGRRKAYALIQIDRCFSSLKVNPTTLRRLGWTKLMVLAPHVTEQNVQQLLAMAEENTVTDCL